MQVSKLIWKGATLTLVSVLAGCATWNSMDHQEKGTAVGATGGAIVGAAVGGPVGAAVGAGVGGYAGHYETEPGGLAANNRAGAAAEPSATVRSAQQALVDRGYNVGPVDGMWGPDTEKAVRDFQRAQRLSDTGRLDQPTLAALGVNRNTSAAAPAASSPRTTAPAR